jgi:hypothetical protein
MPSAELEPAIPATKRPQTYALDRAATGIGMRQFRELKWSLCRELHVFAVVTNALTILYLQPRVINNLLYDSI